MRRILLIVVLIGLPIALLARASLAVDETEFVLVTEFGRPVSVLGEGSGGTGLHWRMPWWSATRVDRRLHVFDAPTRETITADKRNFEVAATVAWRVVDPSRFLQASGSREAAEARIGERVSSALSDTIGRNPSTALASTDPLLWKLDRLTDEVQRSVAPSAKQELGVEIVDVRLRRFTPPVEVRPSVFDLIRSERKQVAATLRAEGESAYRKVIAQAEREADAILARADADAERIRGLADAESTRLLNEAHARDPKFYEFLRTLETYRSLLDEKTTVVLSAGSPLLRLLTAGPVDAALLEPPVRPQAMPQKSNAGMKP